ncbi:hypothetical protein BST45_09555 [Mycobacterium shinjukuense]|nr:hypothetical protein BST45_09555 [Mycobacterium shinjukuense]
MLVGNAAPMSARGPAMVGSDMAGSDMAGSDMAGSDMARSDMARSKNGRAETSIVWAGSVNLPTVGLLGSARRQRPERRDQHQGHTAVNTPREA